MVVISVGVYFLERKLPIFLQAMNRIDLVRQLPCTSKVLIIRVKKHEWVVIYDIDQVLKNIVISHLHHIIMYYIIHTVHQTMPKGKWENLSPYLSFFDIDICCGWMHFLFLAVKSSGIILRNAHFPTRKLCGWLI